MDSFDAVKFEKAKAMLRYNRLRGIAKLLRLAEFFAALLLLSWCSSRLPLAVRFISGFFAGHLFYFLLCNAIILALLLNSGWLSHQSTSSTPAADNAYDRLIENADRSDSEIRDPAPAEAEIVYQDKEMIADSDPASAGHTDLEYFPKEFRRTKSEIKFPEKCTVLRRSETEICRDIVSAGAGEEEEEEMSNEEFQQTIEAFIAKQLKFRRQESTAGVLQTYS